MCQNRNDKPLLHTFCVLLAIVSKQIVTRLGGENLARWISGGSNSGIKGLYFQAASNPDYCTPLPHPYGHLLR